MKQEITNIRRQLKTIQKDLMKAWDITRTAPITDSEYAILEQKEKRFRSLKRRLESMQENLNHMLEGPEPVRVQDRKIRRPSNESRLSAFCEA
ncbi:MAG: hypothetical protein QUS12_10870 [Methanosarcina sp.]|nr:hypothetical protein [Methanosarcina sp.]